MTFARSCASARGEWVSVAGHVVVVGVGGMGLTRVATAELASGDATWVCAL